MTNTFNQIRLRGLGDPVRTYPEALADQLAACRPGDARLRLLNRLYCDLTPADKLRTQGELHRIRLARRGEIFAIIGEVRR